MLEQQQPRPGQGENVKDVEEDTNLPSEAMDTQGDLEKEENMQEMLVESPAAAQDAIDVDQPQVEQESTTQLRSDGRVETVEVSMALPKTDEVSGTVEEAEMTRVTADETEVVRVTDQENENMETNQDVSHIESNQSKIKSNVDDVNTLTNELANISGQGDDSKRTEPVSESMETDQLNPEKYCMTSEGMTATSDEAQGEEEEIRGSEQDDVTVDPMSPEPSDVTMVRVSVATEIEAPTENSDTRFVSTHDVTEGDTPPVAQESEVSPFIIASNQQADVMQSGKSVVMNSETAAGKDGVKASIQEEKSSNDQGVAAELAADTNVEK